MIPPSHKPHSIPPRELPKLERLPKRGRMTIAIGMLCQGGMVVAADTQLTNKDGTTYDRVKIKSETAVTGTFVIAYSCEDLYAAEMLVSDILTDLKLTDPKSLDGVEDIVKSRMAQWASGYGFKDERPYMAFILGVRVEGILALYFCEPPGIFLRQTIENSNGYVAVGAGLVVTDPLFRTLFGPLVPPRVCLAQLSYLMYRAKRDCRGACGGTTDAVLITEGQSDPIWIERGYMRRAEEYGPKLDGTLSRVTASIMSRNGYDDKSRFTKFFDKYFCRKEIMGVFGLYGFVFRARTGEMIWEPEVQKMMDDPEKYLEP